VATNVLHNTEMGTK